MKKAGRILTLALITGCLLTGCNCTEMPNSAKQAAKPIVLNVLASPQWQGVVSADEKDADYDSFLKYAAQKFNQQHPQVQINLEIMSGELIDSTVRARHGTEKAIDVLISGTFSAADYAHRGWIVPLDDVIDETSRADISDNIWDECTLAGQTYFYPFYMLPNTLSYNAALFRQADLTSYIRGKESIATWSVQDFERILAKLHANLPPDVAPLMMYAKNEQGDTHTMTLLRSRGTPMFNAKQMDIDNPAGIAGFQWLKDCADRGYFPANAADLTFMDNMDLFAAGKLAITAVNPSSYQLYNKPDTDIRLANFPAVNGALQTAFILGSNVFANGNAEKEQLAKEFVAFFSSDAELVKSSVNGIPIRDSVLQTEGAKIPLAAAYAKNSKYIVSISNNFPNWLDVRQQYYPALQSLLNGTKTARETALTMQERSNALITTGKVKSVILK